MLLLMLERGRRKEDSKGDREEGNMEGEKERERVERDRARGEQIFLHSH